jgi:hypothetical protein
MKLKKIEVERDFFNKSNEIIINDDLKKLLEAAFILSSSSHVQNRIKALNIATTIPQLYKSAGINISSFYVLRKLGNYPAIALLQAKEKITDYKLSLSGVMLLEAMVGETLNTRQFINKNYMLTNFQKNVVDTIDIAKGVSISAPTSAGKSFVYLKVLLDLVTRIPGSTAIYIVPTRALIKQVMNDFLENIKELDSKNIYVGCSSETELIINNPSKSNILVLTQERLYQLCTNNDIKKLHTKMIVVDEAQNIQSGGRGVLLENALKFAQKIWPEAKVLFSSPLVKNPEKLLETFQIEGIKQNEEFPLVRQNIIKVRVGTKNLNLSTLYEQNEIPLGQVPYVNTGSSIYKTLSSVALALWNNQTSIVYANEPLISTDVVRALSISNQFGYVGDERLDEFADFIEEYIAKDYELANFIRCGIAFHFGALPALIRAGIEDLFKAGALKVVSCTSTLLEGMNMPAKNIFVFKPEKGKNTPIDKLNFWNLAGRAGRMGHDFAGNIVCIELDKWKENPLNGERLENIMPSSEKRLKKESNQFKEYISNRDTASGDNDYDEQLASFIIRESVLGNSLEESTYMDEDNADDLKDIDFIAKQIILDFIPPVELLEKCPGVLPDRINDLWKFFITNADNINNLVPLFPTYLYDKGYIRFKEIVKIINEYLVGYAWNDAFITKISVGSYRWVLGHPLANIIFYNESVLEEGDQRAITKYVKDQMEFLNNTIRYKMVKYTKVYTEVLIIFLKSIGKTDESEKLINISAYLEYGACSAPALEFMAIGLPREAAIKLSSEMPKSNVYSAEECITWLKTFKLDTLKIAPYLKSQIEIVQDNI